MDCYRSQSSYVQLPNLLLLLHSLQ
jgi:hypothetical protein